jgi:hypothetical protein
VSGFGGVNHTNHTQFIDLTSVAFASGQIHLSYTSAAGSGTLSVVSGATLSGGTPGAQINLVGTYTLANFSAKDDGNGNVEIVDPASVLSGGVILSSFHPQRFDLPNIAFGAHTTLAYSQNGAGTTLTVSDGRHAASIALLGHYMAGSFVAVADGHGGTLVTNCR